MSEAALKPTDEFVEYREISWLAVTSLILAVAGCSLVPFVEVLSPLLFGAAPVVGLLLGWLALGRIDRYELTGRRVAKLGMGISSVSAILGWAVMGAIYATEVPDGYERIRYKSLQPEPGKAIPEFAREMDGKRVFIKGYIYPNEPMQNKRELLLCRDKGDCCFGGQPKLTDMIQVTLEGDLRVDYDAGLHAVAGIFRVQSGQALHGKSGVVYQMVGEYFR